jgi:hypothetical protein
VPYFTPEEHEFVRAVFPFIFGIQLDNWHLATKTQKIRNGQFRQYKLSLQGTGWG